MNLKVTRLVDARVPAARAFLEARLETSLFLLASLDRYGPDATEIPTSGNYYELSAADRIEAVFAITRRGHLLAQTGGRRDLVPTILETCRSKGLTVTGVVAEWNAAEAIHAELTAAGSFAPSYVSRNLVCHREMHHDDDELNAPVLVRRLRPGDFDDWFAMYDAFLRDQGSVTPPKRDDLQTHFERRSAAGWWWGAFDGPRLVGIVAVDEEYRTACQIGGLYVDPHDRRRGIARALMAGLQRDCLADAPACRMVLFVRSDNRSAQVFYAGLGFEGAGHFGLIW
jgi:ribosomal protein S18 acetylase RimI-like enzyme